ncbi:DUF3014 domain-containing protein [Pseudidiomarina donghaiensis]|uniref:DUF3014 domain-containing protein n=1 Tax=Pseudidiomarina donghaiensis TaxID=519452 RepID=A0A432XFT8_9GAMM|nr:DUF3014 domain-containing protein [Pseudidiomarina donghaiensis]RUO47482.1 DUF3014 domain-containing protein [Pseudidiomarina donghaiensis]SFV23125.1 Protein of unknown function [Pseudidiomarina donghaiensis]
MRDFGQDQAPAENTTNKLKLIVSVIVVLAVAIVVVFWLAKQQSPQPLPQPSVEPEVAQPVAEEPEPALPEVSETVEIEDEPVAEPVSEPEPVKPLPTLNNSSSAVLEELAELEQDTAPLKGEQLIRDTVVFADNLRQGIVVRDKAVIEPPKGQFRVLEQNGKVYIDPRSYDRYNTVVDWFVSLDSNVLAELFTRYKPLSQSALAEVGYPDENPENVLLDAIDVLLATPSVGTVIELNDDSVMYRYADPTLEALPAAQKQMLRMGPDNIRRVKLKLEELQQALQQ